MAKITLNRGWISYAELRTLPMKWRNDMVLTDGMGSTTAKNGDGLTELHTYPPTDGQHLPCSGVLQNTTKDPRIAARPAQKHVGLTT